MDMEEGIVDSEVDNSIVDNEICTVMHCTAEDDDGNIISKQSIVVP